MNYLISFLLIGVICVPLLMTLTNIIYVFQDCEKVKERWAIVHLRNPWVYYMNTL